MALSNKFLSPTCASGLGDVATYFFFEKIFRSDGGMCVSMTPFLGAICFDCFFEMMSLKHTFLHRIEIFFQKKSMWRYLHEQAHMFQK